jgi:REP element-mobilizing transposase RayT
MGAKLRQELAGGIFHVTSRGNNRTQIFFDELDCLEYLRALATAVSQFGWLCHSYCLLPNHVHLLLETPTPNLALGMRIVNGRFAQRFNRRYGRTGHVFEGPYHAELVARDAHFLETCRYIVLNPVRAGLCSDPAEWPWSSYRALVGLEDPPSFLTTDFVLGCCGGSDGYRQFVADGAQRQRPGHDQVA